MAVLRKPKRPSYKALPKAPKMSASAESWKRYEAKLKAVNAENQKKKAEYEKAVKAYETAIKNREKIKDIAKNANAKLKF